MTTIIRSKGIGYRSSPKPHNEYIGCYHTEYQIGRTGANVQVHTQLHSVAK